MRDESDQEQWNLVSSAKMEPVSETLNSNVGLQNIYLDKNFSKECKFYKFTSIASFHLPLSARL